MLVTGIRIRDMQCLAKVLRYPVLSRVIKDCPQWTGNYAK